MGRGGLVAAVVVGRGGLVSSVVVGRGGSVAAAVVVGGCVGMVVFGAEEVFGGAVAVVAAAVVVTMSTHRPCSHHCGQSRTHVRADMGVFTMDRWMDGWMDGWMNGWRKSYRRAVSNLTEASGRSDGWRGGERTRQHASSNN